MEKVTLRKIPLQVLIDTLVEIYEKGAGYIDIVGVPNETQDEIGLVVREEYYNTDSDDSSELTDDYDLNDLI